MPRYQTAELEPVPLRRAPEDAALDALADALTGRIWERIKARARDEMPNEDEAETIAYLASLGIVPKSR